MSEAKSKTDEFYGWLHERMQEANMTPGEVAELTKWMMSRSCEHPDDGHKDSSVSFTEVIELVSWVKGRMSGMLFKETEKSELSGWLTKRLSAHSCLSEEQLQQALKKLSED